MDFLFGVIAAIIMGVLFFHAADERDTLKTEQQKQVEYIKFCDSMAHQTPFATVDDKGKIKLTCPAEKEKPNGY